MVLSANVEVSGTGVDNPRFVNVHADSNIVTDPGSHSVDTWD